MKYILYRMYFYWKLEKRLFSITIENEKLISNFINIELFGVNIAFNLKINLK